MLLKFEIIDILDGILNLVFYLILFKNKNLVYESKIFI